MDLGLRTLTDDQILELTTQVCDEIVRRDPIVRTLAQQTITTAAERRATFIKLGLEAVKALCGAYIEEIRKESFAYVKAGVKAGTIRLLTAAQEARVVVESVLEAKIALCNETVIAIQHGTHPPAKPEEDETFEDLKQRVIEDYARSAAQKAAIDQLLAQQPKMQIYPNGPPIYANGPPIYHPNPAPPVSGASVLEKARQAMEAIYEEEQAAKIRKHALDVQNQIAALEYGYENVLQARMQQAADAANRNRDREYQIFEAQVQAQKAIAEAVETERKRTRKSFFSFSGKLDPDKW